MLKMANYSIKQLLNENPKEKLIQVTNKEINNLNLMLSMKLAEDETGEVEDDEEEDGRSSNSQEEISLK